MVGLLVTGAACGTAGSGSSPQEADPPQLPTVAAAEYQFPVELAGDYTFEWSAENSLDLRSPEASAIRAFGESSQLALAVGTRLAYPGYAAAIPDEEGLRIPDGGHYPPGAATGNWDTRWAGTFLARIMRIQPTRTGFTAAYCVDHTDVAESFDGGETYTWRQDTPSMPPTARMVWLTVEETGEHRTPVSYSTSPDDLPPLRAPRYDAFDGWRVIDVRGPTTRAVGPDEVEPTQDCEIWTRANTHSNPAYLAETPSRVPAIPPPTAGVPSPGWTSRS